MESDQGFGASTTGSFACYDPDTSSWRTYQRCLFGGFIEFSETWPRAGTTRSGIAFRLPPLAPRTSVTGSGLSAPETVPTPSASGFDCKDADRLRERREEVKAKRVNGNGFGLTLAQWVVLYGTPTASMKVRSEEFAEGRLPNPAEVAKREMFLTLTTSDAKPAGEAEVEQMKIYESGTNVPDCYKRLRSQVAAREALHSPPNPAEVAKEASGTTPKASDADRGGRGELLALVRGKKTRQMWPTPEASLASGGRVSKELGGKRPSGAKRSITLGTAVAHDQSSCEAESSSDDSHSTPSGSLNPQFVEWLMGFPIGWSELGDSETPSSPKSPSGSPSA